MKINKDFYDKLPGGVCQFLDSYIIKYSDEDWFEEAWNKYRRHVLENDITDIKREVNDIKKELIKQQIEKVGRELKHKMKVERLHKMKKAINKSPLI